MNKDLSIIKKHYGEKMMHLCRSLFSTLLEQEGLLSKLMLDNFAPSNFLYDDVIVIEDDFKNYMYNLVDDKKKQIQTYKTPHELLLEAGYNLYECKKESDIQRFKKYYSKGEELCTFRGGRLNRCDVFFAVKKNVEEIKRQNFKTPQRQDEYRTSVISIQFSKGHINTLSIKNRYNHRVNNPDATFSNNLENIIPGLTQSFEREYNLNINQNESNGFELSGYVKANDGKYYKYNYEINNIYYCPNNIIIDNFEVKKYESEKYIILDYFVLDLVNKTMKLYDNAIKDCFLDGIKDIEKINIIKNKETGNKQIEIIAQSQNEIVIEIDKTNRIVGYQNKELTHVGNKFLCFNKELENLDLRNLKYIGDSFLSYNQKLVILNLPNLIEVGDSFLILNWRLKVLNSNKLCKVGNNFLSNNKYLTKLYLENLVEVGDNFLFLNECLRSLNCSKLTKVGKCFLNCNNSLIRFDMPNLVKKGDSFLHSNSVFFYKNNSTSGLKIIRVFVLKLIKKMVHLKYDIMEKLEEKKEGVSKK